MSNKVLISKKGFNKMIDKLFSYAKEAAESVDPDDRYDLLRAIHLAINACIEKEIPFDEVIKFSDA